MKKLYWAGISYNERVKAISDISSTIDRYATILNFQRFSDISLTLILEIEEYKLHSIHDELSKLIAIDKHDFVHSNSKTTTIVFLNITFAKGTGNLIIEVPNISE